MKDGIYAVIDTNVIVSAVMAKNALSPTLGVLNYVFSRCIIPGDSYLVTGNIKHFPVTPKVVTPAEMISIIEAIK